MKILQKIAILMVIAWNADMEAMAHTLNFDTIAVGQVVPESFQPKWNDATVLGTAATNNGQYIHFKVLILLMG
jgi:hypothetical protein